MIKKIVKFCIPAFYYTNFKIVQAIVTMTKKYFKICVFDRKFYAYHIYLSISNIFLYQNIAQKVRCDFYTNILRASNAIQKFFEVFPCYSLAHDPIRYRIPHESRYAFYAMRKVIKLRSCLPHGMLMGMFQRRLRHTI